ncbi:MAG: sigma factor, partial [Streptosporangiaceae bacterium]
MTHQSRAEAEAERILADAEVIQLSRHEPEQFTLLFRRHAPHIQRYVTRRLGPDAADDIVAETFLLAFRQRDRYDQSRADARPWLYGIATNLIGRHRRAEVRLYRAVARQRSFDMRADPVGEPFTDRVDDRVSAGTAASLLAKALGGLSAEDSWTTADGSLSFYADGIMAYGQAQTLYSHLGSLPSDQRALDAYLAKLGNTSSKVTQTNKDVADFFSIQDLLSTDVLSPSLNAELYQALADIPAIQVKSHVTDAAGRAGVAFVLPETSQSANLEIILDASDYSYL